MYTILQYFILRLSSKHLKNSQQAMLLSLRRPVLILGPVNKNVFSQFCSKQRLRLGIKFWQPTPSWIPDVQPSFVQNLRRQANTVKTFWTYLKFIFSKPCQLLETTLSPERISGGGSIYKGLEFPSLMQRWNCWLAQMPWGIINSHGNGHYSVRTLLGWGVNSPQRRWKWHRVEWLAYCYCQ